MDAEINAPQLVHCTARLQPFLANGACGLEPAVSKLLGKAVAASLNYGVGFAI